MQVYRGGRPSIFFSKKKLLDAYFTFLKTFEGLTARVDREGDGLICEKSEGSTSTTKINVVFN